MARVDPAVLDDPATPLHWIANPSAGWDTLSALALQILIDCGGRLPWPENIERLHDEMVRLGGWQGPFHLTLAGHSTFHSAAKHAARAAKHGRDGQQNARILLRMAEAFADEIGTVDELARLVVIRHYCGLDDR